MCLVMLHQKWQMDTKQSDFNSYNTESAKPRHVNLHEVTTKGDSTSCSFERILSVLSNSDKTSDLDVKQEESMDWTSDDKTERVEASQGQEHGSYVGQVEDTLLNLVPLMEPDQLRDAFTHLLKNLVSYLSLMWYKKPYYIYVTFYFFLSKHFFCLKYFCYISLSI